MEIAWLLLGAAVHLESSRVTPWKTSRRFKASQNPPPRKMLPLGEPTLGFKSLVIRSQDLQNDRPAFYYSQRTFELKISNPLIIRSLLSNNQ